MKKCFFLIVMLGFSGLFLPALGLAVEEGFITRIGKWIDGDKSCECPACPASREGVVCPGMAYEKIRRPGFELGLRLDGFESPAGGRPQFHAENFSLSFYHNFSPAFYLYGSYSARKVEKIEYEGSVYDKEWNYQTAIVGAGFYMRPTLKIFAGLGKVIPRNAEGSEELSFALERGVAWDIPLSGLGYKLTISFRSVEASLADDDAHIAASQADASTNILSIELALPLGGS